MDSNKRLNSPPKGNIYSSRSNESYQSYSKDSETLFDEDEDLKSKYMEKELALKKINEELERKSSEIFSKIEKMRKHESPHSLTSRCNYDEVGQGDAPPSSVMTVSSTSLQDYNFDRFRPREAEANNDFPRNLMGEGHLYSPRYFQRPSSSLSNHDISKYLHPSGGPSDSNREAYFSMNRPTTAVASFSSPDILSSPPSSLCSLSNRRPETAKSLEGIEAKHQARLQKATESVLKCVQSKMVNYEQRMTDMQLQFRQKIQENTMLEAKVKALEEDRKKLLKTVQSLQTTTDKFSKSAEHSKMNLNLKVQAFGALRKEMDNLKRDLKQKSGLIQSLQTRFDRCTEENRRLKSQHQSTQLNMKQQQNEDRTTMEDLRHRITQLEQQKSSFQSTVEKQSQLIRNLRSQKVSLTNTLQKHKIKMDDMFENSCGVSDDDERVP